LLPGALEAVVAVREAGGRSVVVTAKYEPNAHLCLAHVCLEVDTVVGWLHGPEKADALVEHGAVAYVGDTPPDMAAARAAGVVGVGVTTGPHGRDELLDAGAHVVLDSLRRFPAWFHAWRHDAAGDGA
jgi:phosphoglycolate phosphatase